MRKSSVNSLFKIINLPNSYVGIDSQLIHRRLKPSTVLSFNSHFNLYQTSKIHFSFSTNANKPPGKPN